LFCLLRRDQQTEQRAHRRTLVGEHPDVALGAGQGERLGQGVHGGVLLAAGRQSQRPQRLDLDDASGAALGGGRRVQPPQQGKCLGGEVLGEQHPGQHQILPRPRVARIIIRAEAALLRPAGGCGHVALRQLQPGPLRRDRVEMADHSLARRHQPGLAHCLPGPSRVAPGLPDPRQGGQARGQRLGVGELPASLNALAELAQRSLEFVPLVGHLPHADEGDPSRRHSRSARRRGDLQRLLVGADRRIETALGPLHLAEVMATVGGRVAIAGRPPFGDAGSEGTLGIRDPAAQPLGHGQ
jgi:hypothetical protein